MRIYPLVSLALLAAAPALATTEPAPSSSFFVDRDDADQPSAASDGDVHLVVWSDRRSATSGADIYGARIRASDGVNLDPGGFAICVEPGDQVVPQVASSGAGSFLVVWADQRAGNDIYASRLSGNTVLDPGGFVVSAASLEGSDAPADQLKPFVASGAGLWLVAWEDWRRSATMRGEVFATRIAADATVLDPNGIRLSTGDGEGDRLHGLASNGTSFVTIHASERFAQASVVFPDGTSRSESPIGGLDRPYSTGETSIASNGDGYLATWNQYDDSAEGPAARELRARFLGAEGEPRGESFVVREAWSRPAIAWTGTDYLIVDAAATETGNALVGTRVTPAGELLDGAGFFLAEDAAWAAASAANGTVLVVAAREDDVLAVGVNVSGGGAWTVEPSDPSEPSEPTAPAPSEGDAGPSSDGGIAANESDASDAPAAGCSVAPATSRASVALVLPFAALVAFQLRRRRTSR